MGVNISFFIAALAFVYSFDSDVILASEFIDFLVHSLTKTLSYSLCDLSDALKEGLLSVLIKQLHELRGRQLIHGIKGKEVQSLPQDISVVLDFEEAVSGIFHGHEKILVENS